MTDNKLIICIDNIKMHGTNVKKGQNVFNWRFLKYVQFL